MARRRYLIAYDISDDKRLRRVVSVMKRFGQRLQYSVFVCDLSGAERATWEVEIRAVVNLGQDSIVTIDLGPQGAAAPIRWLGTPRTLPTSGPTIV
ncbi:MAG: CRISPR-associated endonuclease Cas2 [Frankiaceae bacterium]|jgi:CRISPR-associated protein Cas2|nr:CRISPR-associated endonuclease Cas2 [Frankiaceae bacterium]